MGEVSREDVARFYNEFSDRQQRDFVFGNTRVAAAILRVNQSIDASTKSILDVGCGCGQLAWEYATKNPQIEVLGLDISPKNIEVAQALFDLPNLRYEVSDLSTAPSGKYDIVALIDVYEHIPLSDRDSFHQNIAACMSDDGALVLTTPTPMYQRFLAEHKPEELQVVDEIVELDDLLQFASVLNASPLLFEWMAIWKKYDYTHFVAARNREQIGPRPASKASFSIYAKVMHRIQQMLSIRARKKLVRDKLGIDVRRS